MRKRLTYTEPSRHGNSLPVLITLVVVATVALVLNTTYTPVKAPDATSPAPMAVQLPQARQLIQQSWDDTDGSLTDPGDSQGDTQEQEHLGTQEQGHEEEQLQQLEEVEEQPASPSKGQVPGPARFAVSQVASRSSWALGAPWFPPKYSTHTCISQKFDDFWQGNTCKFDNICLNATTLQFEYYQDPDYPDTPVMYDQAGKPYFQFPERFVNPGHIMEGRDTAWRPVVKRKKFPQGAGVKWARWDQALLTTIPTRFTFNFGHIMYDALVPLFNMQHLFGIYDRSAQIIILGPQGQGETYSRLRKKLQRNIQHPNPDMSLLRLHWDRYAMWLREVVKAELKGSTDGLVCFKTALVGTGMLSRRMSRVDSLPYRQAAFEHLGLKEEPQSVPAITILNKQGRRMIENVDEIAAVLTARYPGAKVNVVDFGRNPDMTLAQQLKLMSETSILISPCGGLATVLTFMQPGATALVMNFWNTQLNRSMNMEDQFYRNLEYLDIQYFPVLPEDYEGTRDRPGCELREGGGLDHHRYPRMGALLNCNLRFKQGTGLARLAHFVDNALLRWAARTGHYEAVEPLRRQRASELITGAGAEGMKTQQGEVASSSSGSASGSSRSTLEAADEGTGFGEEDDYQDDYLERRRQ